MSSREVLVEKARSGRGAVPSIPNKLYFRIGEVSDLVGVKPYVLRYWESEFPDIKPSKSKSGQRLYKRRDVEMLLRIKGLLYDERFTINGARKRLKDWTRSEAREETEPMELPEEGPRQLEVFGAVEPDPVEEILPVAGARAPREGSKILVKIRRDLESLLHLVRQ